MKRKKTKIIHSVSSNGKNIPIPIEFSIRIMHNTKTIVVIFTTTFNAFVCLLNCVDFLFHSVARQILYEIKMATPLQHIYDGIRIF